MLVLVVPGINSIWQVDGTRDHLVDSFSISRHLSFRIKSPNNIVSFPFVYSIKFNPSNVVCLAKNFSIRRESTREFYLNRHRLF